MAKNLILQYESDYNKDNVASIHDVEYSIRTAIYEDIREAQKNIKKYTEQSKDKTYKHRKGYYTPEKMIERNNKQIENLKNLDKKINNFFSQGIQENSPIKEYDKVKESFYELGKFLEPNVSKKISRLIKIITEKASTRVNKSSKDYRAEIVVALKKLEKSFFISEDNLKFPIPVCKSSTIKYSYDKITKIKDFEYKLGYPQDIKKEQLLSLIDKSRKLMINKEKESYGSNWKLSNPTNNIQEALDSYSLDESILAINSRRLNYHANDKTSMHIRKNADKMIELLIESYKIEKIRELLKQINSQLKSIQDSNIKEQYKPLIKYLNNLEKTYKTHSTKVNKALTKLKVEQSLETITSEKNPDDEIAYANQFRNKYKELHLNYIKALENWGKSNIIYDDALNAAIKAKEDFKREHYLPANWCTQIEDMVDTDYRLSKKFKETYTDEHGNEVKTLNHEEIIEEAKAKNAQKKNTEQIKEQPKAKKKVPDKPVANPNLTVRHFGTMTKDNASEIVNTLEENLKLLVEEFAKEQVTFEQGYYTKSEAEQQLMLQQEIKACLAMAQGKNKTEQGLNYYHSKGEMLDVTSENADRGYREYFEKSILSGNYPFLNTAKEVLKARQMMAELQAENDGMNM